MAWSSKPCDNSRERWSAQCYKTIIKIQSRVLTLKPFQTSGRCQARKSKVISVTPSTERTSVLHYERRQTYDTYMMLQDYIHKHTDTNGPTFNWCCMRMALKASATTLLNSIQRETWTSAPNCAAIHQITAKTFHCKPQMSTCLWSQPIGFILRGLWRSVQ